MDPLMVIILESLKANLLEVELDILMEKCLDLMSSSNRECLFVK